MWCLKFIRGQQKSKHDNHIKAISEVRKLRYSLFHNCHVDELYIGSGRIPLLLTEFNAILVKRGRVLLVKSIFEK